MISGIAIINLFKGGEKIFPITDNPWYYPQNLGGYLIYPLEPIPAVNHMTKTLWSGIYQSIFSNPTEEILTITPLLKIIYQQMIHKKFKKNEINQFFTKLKSF